MVEDDIDEPWEPIEVDRQVPMRELPHDGGVGRTLLTISEVCRHLAIARSTWDKWRQKQIAPPVINLPNGSLRVDADDLTAWLYSQRESA